jgi:hypothetical protein
VEKSFNNLKSLKYWLSTADGIESLTVHTNTKKFRVDINVEAPEHLYQTLCEENHYIPDGSYHVNYNLVDKKKDEMDYSNLMFAATASFLDCHSSTKPPIVINTLTENLQGFNLLTRTLTEYPCYRNNQQEIIYSHYWVVKPKSDADTLILRDIIERHSMRLG